MLVKKRSILQVGPFILPDQLPKLYNHFKTDGFVVYKKSTIKNRYFRFLDTILFLVFSIRKYDVVIIHTFGFFSFFLEYPTILIAHFFKKRLVLYIHGGAFIDFYEKYEFFVKRYILLADIIATPSHFLRIGLENKGYLINVIPNTIDSEIFYFTNSVKRPFSILWVRAFHEIYQPFLVLDILNCLKEKYPNINITMIGPDQGLLADFISKVKDNSLEKYITIAGRVDNNELVKYYNTHQVFLTTTKFESFGVAILEAARCKIPQVSTSVGEIPLMWENGIEILLCESNGLSLSHQIDKLFNSEELRNNIAEAAYFKSLRYDWEFVKSLWYNII